MNALSNQINTGDLPRLGRIDLTALWEDIPLRSVVHSFPPELSAFEARHDEWTEKIRIMGLDGGLLVDYRILPGLDRLVESLYGPAGWARPEVYVVSDLGRKGIDSWSAISVVSKRQPVILLGSSLVETMTEVELAFVVGHETGHLLSYTGRWCQEMSLSFLIRHLGDNNQIQELDNLCPGSDWRQLYRAVMENCRVMETRCDRLGLLMCGSLDAAAVALLLVALKNPILARNVNVTSYMSVHYPLLATAPAAGPISVNAGHPFVPQRIRAMSDFVQSGQCRALTATFAR